MNAETKEVETVSFDLPADIPSLVGTPGELRFTLEIIRAGTGKKEVYEMVGKLGESSPEDFTDKIN